MTEICIIRHGETDWNLQSKMQGRSDIPLNEKGREQARVTAEYLKNDPWDMIYSSPLSRAFETAEIISETAGLPFPTIEEDLIECDFGVAEGMIISERKALYPDLSLVPGVEPFENVKSRAVKIITGLSERHADKRIIIVSHACFIREAISAFSKEKLNGRKIILKNLSMTLLTHDTEWNIPWYNRSAEETGNAL